MRRATTIGLGLSGATLVFLFSYRFVLHHFETGPYLWDSGWLSYAIFQNGFLLPNPPYLWRAVGSSVITQHFYGLASLASPVSHWFPTHYHYFATVVGATHAVGFLGPFLAVLAIVAATKRRITSPLLATVSGLGFCFSGPVLSSVGYPHFEIAVPGLFLLFLSLALIERGNPAPWLRWTWLKWVALGAAVIVREDAGTHCLVYLAAIGVLQAVTRRAVLSWRTIATAMGVAVVAAGSMLVLQRTYFPLGASMFEKSFVGDPAFAHVTWTAARERTAAFFHDSPAIYVPALVILVAGVVRRVPIYFVMYLVCLPWVALNVLFSLTPAAQTLSLYYGFPLLVGLAWPLFAAHWLDGAARERACRAAIPTFLVAASVSALVLPSRRAVVDAAIAGGSIPAATFDQERRCLVAEFARAPALYADTAIVAMFPHDVPSRRVLNVRADVAAARADSFIFFDNAMADAYRARARELGLWYETALDTPRIRILSRELSPFGECVLVKETSRSPGEQ